MAYTHARATSAARFTRLHSLPVFVAMLLILAACNPGSSAGAGDLTIKVTSPADGAEVTTPFMVQIESNVPMGPPESGNHHAHLYFDTDISSSDYDLVYANSAQVTRPLSPGKHTIIASLRNPDHSDAGPSQTFTVTVTGAGSAPPSAAPTPTTGGY